jgi:hypothetical protein
MGIIAFPCWRYHRTLPARIVYSAEEEKALGEGWADTPAAFLEPEPKPVITEPEPSDFYVESVSKKKNPRKGRA